MGAQLRAFYEAAIFIGKEADPSEAEFYAAVLARAVWAAEPAALALKRPTRAAPLGWFESLRVGRSDGQEGDDDDAGQQDHRQPHGWLNSTKDFQTWECFVVTVRRFKALRHLQLWGETITDDKTTNVINNYNSGRKRRRTNYIKKHFVIIA